MYGSSTSCGVKNAWELYSIRKRFMRLWCKLIAGWGHASEQSKTKRLVQNEGSRVLSATESTIIAQFHIGSSLASSGLISSPLTFFRVYRVYHHLHSALVFTRLEGPHTNVHLPFATFWLWNWCHHLHILSHYQHIIPVIENITQWHETYYYTVDCSLDGARHWPSPYSPNFSLPRDSLFGGVIDDERVGQFLQRLRRLCVLRWREQLLQHIARLNTMISF